MATERESWARQTVWNVSKMIILVAILVAVSGARAASLWECRGRVEPG